MKKVLEHVLAVALIAVLLGALIALVTGCAGMPRTVYVDNEAGGVVQETQIPHYFPGTDIELYSTKPAVEGGTQDWLDIALSVAAGLFGLSQFTPRGLRNWATVLAPSASWPDTGKALAANLVGTHSPKPEPEPPA